MACKNLLWPSMPEQDPVEAGAKKNEKEVRL